MADFKTHITVSTGVGIAYGLLGYSQFQLPVGTCVIAGGLCSVSGMLPDLDSDSGIPIRETKAFTSAVIPMLMIERFERMGMSHASMALVGGAIYFLLRFVVWNLFKRYTKHRGMWHSIPAAMIAGLLAFLVCSSQDVSIRMFRAWAVFLGFMSHLVMDELYSVDLNGRTLKRSFGTAMKFFGNNAWANVFTYLKLGLFGMLAINDPMLQESLQQQQIQLPQYAQVAIDSLQFKSLREWIPHDHMTREDFDPETLLPIRKRGNRQARRRKSREPGQLTQWLNYFTGSQISPSTNANPPPEASSPAPAFDSFNPASTLPALPASTSATGSGEGQSQFNPFVIPGNSSPLGQSPPPLPNNTQPNFRPPNNQFDPFRRQ